MLGSMLMLGFRGAELAPGDPFLAAVRSGNVGHVLLLTAICPAEASATFAPRSSSVV